MTSRFPVPDAPAGRLADRAHPPTEPRRVTTRSPRPGVDHLAIGGPHRAEIGRAGNVSWGASGAPELVDEATTAAGEVLVVTLDDAGARPVVEQARVGQHPLRAAWRST